MCIFALGINCFFIKQGICIENFYQKTIAVSDSCKAQPI